MKKQLVVALGLAVLATPAFASKARLLALGESADGSFFINDNRNIFLNAAEVNNHKDLVTFEWGTGSSDAEGGFLKSHNNLVYGLQLGRENSMNDTVNTLHGGTADAYQLSNTIDLFVGGDAGIKWGANLSYGAGEDEAFTSGTAGTAETEGRTVDLNLGVVMGDLSAYVKAGVLGKVEQKDADATELFDMEVERKLAVEVGAAYKLQNYTVFGQVGMAKFEENEADAELKEQNLSLGVARVEKLNDKTSMFVKLSANYSKDETDAAVDTEDKSIFVPVAIGLEHDATSWLALRGSISQDLWSKNENDNGTTSNESTNRASTSVNAGASLLFGDLTVDGVIGAAATGGTLGFNDTLSQVSMTYRF